MSEYLENSFIPGWSTLKIKHLREIASAFFFVCVNNLFELVMLYIVSHNVFGESIKITFAS